jgi:hypothetical protein
VIYRGDPEEDFEWMIVIHEAEKVFTGSVYYPPQGSSISKRFIDKVQKLQSQGFDFIIAGDYALSGYMEEHLLCRLTIIVCVGMQIALTWLCG